MRSASRPPIAGRNWQRESGDEQLTYYKRMLLELDDIKKTTDPTVLAIFTDAQTKLRKPANLKSLTSAIDKLDWYSAREEGLGNLYEGLLEKTPPRRNPAPGSISRRAPSSTAWSD
jgi:type I restriction enzyme M protein